MKNKMIITAVAMTVSAFSFAQLKPAENVEKDGFKVLPSGLEYKFIKDEPGDKKPKIGDQIHMHFISRIKDSVLFNSKEMQQGKPVIFTVVKPSYEGDVFEGFAMLTKGDEAKFRTSIEAILKSGQQVVGWNATDKIEYDIQVVDVKTAEEVKKEIAEATEKQLAIDEQLLTDYFKTNNLKPLKTESGLYYVINKKGTGANAKAGQKVTVNYTGKLLNGELFDSNTDPAFHHVQPFSFTLGRGQVIKGWDEGIALLNKGSKATLYLPSRMAYGAASPSTKIPANSILIFDVELVDAVDVPGAEQAPQEHDGHEGHQH